MKEYNVAVSEVLSEGDWCMISPELGRSIGVVTLCKYKPGLKEAVKLTDSQISVLGLEDVLSV